MIKQKDGTITHVGLVHSHDYTTQCQGEVRTDYLNIFNPLTNELESFEIGFYCQGKYQANLEFTIDLLPQYKQILEDKRNKLEQERELTKIRIGKTVKVLSGKNKGSIGQVFWEGKDKFNAGNAYGIKTKDKTFFINEFSLEIYFTKLEKALK